MEGLQLKKAPERHTRQKKVVPGEANVSKWEPISTTPAPFQTTNNVASVSPTTPLNLQFTDERDERDAYRRGPGAFTDNVSAKKQLVPAESRVDLSDEELRKRIRALEEAMAAMDAGHKKFRLRGFKGGDNSEYEAPYYPYSPGEEHPAMPLADFNWNKHDWMDDTLYDITDDPVALYLEQLEHAKAAATGNALEDQHNHYMDNHGIPGIGDAMAEERQYGNLFQEYNNLKNEYNRRLASYLQSQR